MNKFFKKIIVLFFIFSFGVVEIFSIYPLTAYAQNVLSLPSPGTMIDVSHFYVPAMIRGMRIHPHDPFRFEFIIDVGDDKLQGDQLKKESEKLIKYFMATLTVPEDEMWVNLSPYESDRIIADGLGKTAMGRDMLVEDYILKQLTASLMYPEDDLGGEFWERVNEKVRSQYGIKQIPVNTFNKVWIVPDQASVYVSERNIFVVKSSLKVMLESDYLDLESINGRKKYQRGEPLKDVKEVSQITSSVVREIILPEIEREVNEGKNFSNLRQIFHSMILATWYKQNLKESILSRSYLNQNKTNGIQIHDKNIKAKIYQQYLKAYKRGAYDFIREDYDQETQQVIPQKYFSGGIKGPRRVDSEVNPPKDYQIFLEKRKLVKVEGYIKEPSVGSKSEFFRMEDELDFSMVRYHSIFLKEATSAYSHREQPYDVLESGIIKEGVPQTLKAKVIYYDFHSSLPDGWKIMNAASYYFSSDDGEFIIVLNSNMGAASQKGISFPREAKFHEATEILLREDYGLNEHEAYIIASALQRQKFSKVGELTPYDQYIAKNISLDNVRDLQLEYEQGRTWHHAILQKGIRLGMDINLDYIKKYEDLFYEELSDPGYKTVRFTKSQSHKYLDVYIGQMLERMSQENERQPRVLIDLGIGDVGEFSKNTKLPEDEVSAAPTFYEWLQNLRALEQRGIIAEGFELVGVDIDEETVLKAGKRLKALLRSDAEFVKKVKLQSGSFNELVKISKRSGTVDFVRMLNVLMHYSDRLSQKSARNIIRKALSVGARFLDANGPYGVTFKKTSDDELVPVEIVIEFGKYLRFDYPDKSKKIWKQYIDINTPHLRGSNFEKAVEGIQRAVDDSLIDWVTVVTSEDFDGIVDDVDRLWEDLAARRYINRENGFIPEEFKRTFKDHDDFDQFELDTEFKGKKFEIFNKIRYSRGLNFFTAVGRNKFVRFSKILFEALPVDLQAGLILDQENGLITIQLDNAVLASLQRSPGGIDFNANILNLQTQGESLKFDVNFDCPQAKNLQIDGATPVITNIVPVINTGMLLGE